MKPNREPAAARQRGEAGFRRTNAVRSPWRLVRERAVMPDEAGPQRWSRSDHPALERRERALRCRRPHAQDGSPLPSPRGSLRARGQRHRAPTGAIRRRLSARCCDSVVQPIGRHRPALTHFRRVPHGRTDRLAGALSQARRWWCELRGLAPNSGGAMDPFARDVASCMSRMRCRCNPGSDPDRDLTSPPTRRWRG
jgi:hypothetical protein